MRLIHLLRKLADTEAQVADLGRRAGVPDLRLRADYHNLAILA
jgi:hypothetical protein